MLFWTNGALTTMSKSRGYSLDFAQQVGAADRRLPWVKLGLLCIEKRISIIDIAKELKVSRQTVYWWFTGKSRPRSVQIERIKEVLARLSA